VCECNTNETVKPNQAMLLFTYLLLLTVLVDEFKSVLLGLGSAVFGLGHFQGSIIRLSGAAETCFLSEEKMSIDKGPPISFCDKMCVLESIFY